MSAHVLRARAVAARIRRWAASSAWAPLAGRAGAYLLAFVLLALVGSGRLSQWLTPAPRLVIGVAEAAPPPTSSAATSAEASSAAPAAEASSAPPVADVKSGVAPGATGAPEATLLRGDADAGADPEEDAGASKGVASDGKIILNLATEADLRRLPHVGHKKAQAILALRAQMKKFTRVEDLLKVKGIGRRALARLRPLVRVD